MMRPLGRVFRHQRHIRGDKGLFIITDIARVGLTFHALSLASFIQSGYHALAVARGIRHVPPNASQDNVLKVGTFEADHDLSP
jgi:hypothetical protein